jgi:hypothetical protein
VVAVEPLPRLPEGVERLVGHRQRRLLTSGGLRDLVRELTVAKLDSIASLVRRCRQFSAGSRERGRVLAAAVDLEITFGTGLELLTQLIGLGAAQAGPQVMS